MSHFDLAGVKRVKMTQVTQEYPYLEEGVTQSREVLNHGSRLPHGYHGYPKPQLPFYTTVTTVTL